MTTLRASQIETLEAIQACDGERATPSMVGGLVNCSLRSAKHRLRALADARYLYVQLGLRKGRYFDQEFGLTSKGRSELKEKT